MSFCPPHTKLTTADQKRATGTHRTYLRTFSSGLPKGVAPRRSRSLTTIQAVSAGGSTPVAAAILAIYASACASVGGASPQPPSTQKAVTTTSSSTVSFVAWIDQQYELELQTSPIQMTFLGRDDLKDQIDDMSVAHYKKTLALRAKSVEEMRGRFDYKALSPSNQIAYDLWIYQYELMKEQLPFINDQYFFHQMDGYHAVLPTVMINFHRVETAKDMTAYIQRLKQFPRAFDQLIERANIGATQRGIKTPKFALEATITQSKAIVSGQPFSEGKDSDLWADIKREIASLEKAKTLTTDEADRTRSAAKEALLTAVLPAYQKVISWAQAMLKNPPTIELGISNQPNGRAHYAFLLKQQTTTTASPEEIHDIGLREIKRIRAEMVGIMKKVQFSGDLQDFFAHIRSSDWNYYPNTDKGRQAYIDDATKAVERIKQNLPDFFGILPKAELVVKRVEPFRERDGAAQHYYPGTPDGSRPGVYYAHLSDMTAMPKNQLEVIAYHEAIPGHHMQISIAQELSTVPKFQTQAFFGAYLEGWALYSEALAKEIPGTYADPYSDFGRLTTEIWRAIRLVVDTGLHTKGWTAERAIAFFKENSPEPIESITSEVHRYLVMPGQATSYKMGMLRIQSLRRYAEKALGEQFRLKEFHDQVLGSGALPLDLLDRKIHNWVADKSSAALSAKD